MGCPYDYRDNDETGFNTAKQCAFVKRPLVGSRANLMIHYMKY